MANLLLVAVSVVLGAALSLWMPWYRVVPPAAVLGGGLFGLHFAWQAMVRTRPRLAAILSTASYGYILALVLLTTYLSVVLGAALPKWVAGSGSPLSESASGVIVGAISALVGAAWLDNAKKPEGSLWPEAAYRLALRRKFAGDPKLNDPRPPQMERLYQATFDDRTANGDISGWGLAARWRRARVIANHD